MTEQKEEWKRPIVLFSEKNMERWALFGTDQTKDERILERKDISGQVVERCRIGVIVYNGKKQTLTTSHGRMMNLIKALFFKQGKPSDNWIKISSPALYDFLIDIASLNDPSRRKFRHTTRYRDWVYDLLFVLTSTSIMFESWKLKGGGSVAVERMNLLDGFQIYGKTKDAERGFIKIRLNSFVANGLRANNTSPKLIEIENSIKNQTAWVLYRYLDKVLYKKEVVDYGLKELSNLLKIGADREDRLASQFRVAAKEIQGLSITCGRIVECKIYKKQKQWRLIAKRGVKNDLNKKNKPISQKETLRSEYYEVSELRKRYDQLSDNERLALQPKIDALIIKNNLINPNALGYKFAINTIIADIMDEYYSDKNNKLIHNYCVSPTNLIVAKEPIALYNTDSTKEKPRKKRRALQHLARTMWLVLSSRPVMIS